MSDGEWEAFVDALEPSLGSRLEIDDHTPAGTREAAARI